MLKTNWKLVEIHCFLKTHPDPDFIDVKHKFAFDFNQTEIRLN